MKQKSILLIPIMIALCACSQKEIKSASTVSTPKSTTSTQSAKFHLPQKPPAINAPSSKESTRNAYKEKKLQEMINTNTQKDGKLGEKRNKYGKPYHDNNPIDKIIKLDIPQF